MIPLSRILYRFSLLCFLWWVLTEGHPESWWFGLPVVSMTTFATLRLSSQFKWRWHPMGIIRFMPFFFWQSLSGGIDVAWRALNPRMPLNPALIEYPIRLPEGPACIFLANTISLLPGTCSTSLHGQYLRVHVLDGAMPIHAALQAVEERIASLFGVRIRKVDGRKEILTRE